MNLRNFSFHSNSVRTEQFLLLTQGETLSIRWIDASVTTRFLVALLFLALVLLSLPGNFAIVAAVFRNGLNDRPVNLLILIDQCVNSVQMYQTSLMYQYTLIFKGWALGEDFCRYLHGFGIFGLLNTTLGSLPVAVFRLIVLSCTKAVSLKKQHVISRCLLVTCLIANLYMTWIITSLPLTEAGTFKGVCLQRNTQLSKVLVDYIRSNDTRAGHGKMILGATAFLQHV